MTNTNEIYKCEICGNMIETLKNGEGLIKCCEEKMKKMHPQTNECEYSEKHLPTIITEDDNWINIQVGKEIHPMTNEHYIQFIEIMFKNENSSYKKCLKPNDSPTIKVPKCMEIEEIRAYCNLHGLWTTKK